MIRDGWCSVNYIRNSPWRTLHKHKKNVEEEVRLHVLSMPNAEKEKVLLRSPKKRVLDFTIISRRGSEPDRDNLIGGLKFTIDALRRCRLKRVPSTEEGKKFSLQKLEDGPGFIWDDDPQWFEIGEVKWDRETKVWPEGTRFVHVSVRDSN